MPLAVRKRCWLSAEYCLNSHCCDTSTPILLERNECAFEGYRRHVMLSDSVLHCAYKHRKRACFDELFS